jgi:hypothetical protein
MSAATHFFAIPELLEMTLLYVPTLQVLVIQRVNTSFRNVVKESGALQEKLFLKAIPNNSTTSPIEWNPFMRTLETRWEHNDLQQLIWRGCRKIRMTDLKNVQHNASWMRMFVCQPPPAYLGMMRFGLVCGRSWGFLANVQAENTREGCRMEDIHKYGWHDVTLGDDCYVRVDGLVLRWH